MSNIATIGNPYRLQSLIKGINCGEYLQSSSIFVNIHRV